MSRSPKSDSESSFDVEDLIRTRCRELRKEKDMLGESQFQSFELIRRLEQHVRTLSEARSEDKKHIQEMERELRNCSQEIDFLQDQLNSRNKSMNFLDENAQPFELKLVDMENLQEMVYRLQEELTQSNSERLLLMQELECKEVELQKSTSRIEKLEESFSSVALEFQCEIESMRLDVMALEQSCFEAKKFKEETSQENDQMSDLIQELKVRLQDEQIVIDCLCKDNKELREKLEKSEMNARVFRQKIEEHLVLEDVDGLQCNTRSSSDEPESKLTVEEVSSCGDVLGPLLSELTTVTASGENWKGKVAKMSNQIHEYEILINQLKEELREEKLRAKEEAEDLAQEMAELRYQITDLLEQECKRRASIEQASLQRISELEAQIRKEQETRFVVVKHLHEV